MISCASPYMENVMDFKEVENNLEIALNLLREKDSFLLQNNVSERSIAHKFAQYLTPLFPEHDVDCEYCTIKRPCPRTWIIKRRR